MYIYMYIYIVYVYTYPYIYICIIIIHMYLFKLGNISRLGPALKKYLDSHHISYTALDGEIRARINS
jgi:hypothetical protein